MTYLSKEKSELIQSYLDAGYQLVPIAQGSKKPYAENWESTTFTLDSFQPCDSIGLKLGTPFNGKGFIADLDGDCMEAANLLQKLQSDNPTIAFGHEKKPCSHLLFLTDKPVITIQFKDPTNKKAVLELRGLSSDDTVGCQTVIPPSRHETGGIRYFEENSTDEPRQIEADKLIRDAHKLASASLIAKHMTEGSQNPTLLSLHGLLFRAGWSEEQVLKFARLVYIARWGTKAELAQCESEAKDSAKRFQKQENQYGYPTLIELIPQAVVNSALDWLGVQYSSSGNTATTEEIHFTDYGNARIVLKEFGERIKACSEDGEFYVYNGEYWESGSVLVTDLYHKAIKKELRRYVEMMPSSDGDATRRKKAVDHYLKSENTKTVRDSLTALKNIPEIQVSLDEFDNNPNILPVKNGVLDLRTGTLLPFNPSQMVTRKIPLNWNPSAKSELWKNYLQTTFRHNQEMIEYIQRAVGYTLFGTAREEIFFTMIGPGGYGKGTFFTAIQSILGGENGYAMTIDKSTLTGMISDGSKPSPDIARLKGARLAVCQELNYELKINEAVVKSITGRDSIVVRNLHSQPFEYTPQFTMWLSMNKPPKFDGSDTGIARRLRPMFFTHKPANPDTTLKDKFKDPIELEGILNWAVQGAVKYFTDGLQEPQAILEMRDEVMEGNNPVIVYFEENFVRAEGVPLKDCITLKKFVENFNSYERVTNNTSHSRSQIIDYLQAAQVELVNYKHVMILKGYILRTPDNDDRAAYFDLQKVDSKRGNILNA